MPATVSTAVVRGRALQLCGLPLTGFGSTTAQNDEIVASARRLHDELILAGAAYQTGTASLTVTAGVQETSALPADAYFVNTAHLVRPGSPVPEVVELEQWQPTYVAEALAVTGGRARPRWFELSAMAQPTLLVDILRLWPTPDLSTYTVFVHYTSAPTFVTSGGEIFMPMGNGWEDFLVRDLSLKLLGAEETDDSVHYREREAARATIVSLAGKRRAGPPARPPIRGPQTGSRRLLRSPSFR